MSDDFAELKETYKVEAAELLADFESVLIDLEDNPNSSDVLEQVLRLMHSLKGSADMVGFTDVAGFTHELESFFEIVRDNELPIEQDLINLVLQALDLIKAMLDLQEAGVEDIPTAAQGILKSVKVVIDKALGAGPRSSSDEESEVESNSGQEMVSSIVTGNGDDGSDDEKSYRIRFRPNKTAFLSTINYVTLLDEIRSLGDSVVTAQIEHIDDPELYDPEQCYIYWDIVLSTNRGINEIKDIFIFVDDSCEVKIEIVDDSNTPGDDYKKVGDILVEKGELKQEQVKEILSEQKKFGEKVVEKGLVDKSKVDAALAEQNFIRQKKKGKTAQKSESAASVSTIRVESHKLDHMVDLVGELVTVQSSLSALSSRERNMEMQMIAEQVERLTTELRENTMSIRMVQIGTIFTNFKRLIRDLSTQLGKKVKFDTFGGDTELDKTIVEQIKDPLIHILRNSVDHGIEKDHVRIGRGKSAEGTVRLQAYHSGGYVNIEIQDDGGGIDPEKVRNKAIEKGLISDQEKLSEKQCFDLIFSSGFSTAGQVTNVSGRGVGMDVVKKTVVSLSGSIEIRSRVGEGSTFVIKLPLTLAIIDGLLVNIKDEKYIIPLAIVHECVELPRKNIKRGRDRKLFELRGEHIPYANLREEFSIEGDGPPIQQVVVCKVGDGRVGLIVDFIVGKHQTVIKTLSGISKEADCISGATVLGDGGVALILDVQKLTSSIENVELKEVAV